MRLPADEMAVVRSVKPPRCYWSNSHHVLTFKEIGDDFAEAVCDAIAMDPKAIRAMIRRAQECGGALHGMKVKVIE